MAAEPADPLLWRDLDEVTPPVQWQAIESDERWWWSDAGGFSGNPGPVIYIGDLDLPPVLEFAWEVTSGSVGSGIEFAIFDPFNAMSLVDTFPLVGAGQTGSGELSVALADYPGQLGPKNFAFGITGIDPDYFGTVAVLGPAGGAPAPVPPSPLSRGPAITAIEFDAMNSAFIDWLPGYQGNDVYEHYAHDPRDPKVYYLFPRLSDKQVLVKHTRVPPRMDSLADEYPLGEEYFNAAVDYVLYRALTKDSRHSAGPDQRRELWDNFLRSLGIKIQSDRRMDPAVNRPPGDEHG